MQAQSPSVVFFSGWYSEKLLQAHQDIIFVFGDNVRGVGTGGQACIRYEKNALGVPTKRVGTMAPGAFFSDKSQSDIKSVNEALGRVEEILSDGGIVVVPVNEAGGISLGLERAQLPVRAPGIYQLICDRIKEMGQEYGATHAEIGNDLTRISKERHPDP